jgi:hypothetical protein
VLIGRNLIGIRRPAVAVTASLLLLVLAGCSKDEKKDPAQFMDGSPVAASADPEPEAKPVPEKTTIGTPEIAKNPDGTVNSAKPKPVTAESTMSAGGLGPYKIGATLKELQAADLVGKTSPLRADNCPDYVGAKGKAKYHSPELVFFDGRLLRMAVTADGITTSRGVKIGGKMATVKQKYPDGKQIDDSVGKAAWLSSIGDYGLLFESKGDKVSSLQAGMTEPMQFKYTDNQGC